MNHFYLLINEAAIYMKHGAYFEATLLANEPEKSKVWEKIEAEDEQEARQIGIALRRWRYPNANWTLGEPRFHLSDRGRPIPREPQTDYERAEASASELRKENMGEVMDMLKRKIDDRYN